MKQFNFQHPEPGTRDSEPGTRLPKEFQRYFWDVAFEELTIEKYPRFIAERLLNYGDLNGIRWLLSLTDRKFIRTLVNDSRNLNPKTRNYWQIILAEVPD
jgi:hypothetical protein